MHTKLINISLKYRLMVVLAILFTIGFGSFQYQQLPVDAFPDISPVMVPVFTEADGMAPEEVERIITFPVESVMNGLPGIKQIKSTSAFGMSVVYVYFNDDIDIYFARQLVAERLNKAITQLPDLPEKPTLGPISTGLGQVFIYYLDIDDSVDTQGKDHMSYLRDINDWQVKRQLQTVAGVTDILSIGGHVLQYQVNIDPDKLLKYDLALSDVTQTITANNSNVGGQYIVTDQEENLVRGIGLLKSIEDIEAITLKSVDGTPIRVADIAQVKFGKAVRRGVVSHNGSEEVVSGIVMQLYGQNTSKVIKDLYAKLPTIQKSLPSGVSIVPYYQQQELVQKATSTVKTALLIGAVLAAVTLLIFLGNLRTAVIVVFSLPFSAFIAVILMRYAGISANLMSLGGIAIAMGMLVDGAIVMVENIYRHLSQQSSDKIRSRIDIIMDAALEVARPIIFSLLIVIIVFIPIVSLEGVEGKMFAPMAYSLCFALLGSLLYAIVIVPPLSSYLLHVKEHKESAIFTFLQKLHDPLLFYSVRKPLLVLLLVLLVLAASIITLPHIGNEFIPTLEEGSILIGVTMAPSISLEKAVKTVQDLETRIIAHNEVKEVVSRVGRPEAGSHPHPVNYAEIHLELQPQNQWTGEHKTKIELIEELSHQLSQYPGIQLNFTQPIQNAFDELLSGVKAQIAIKLFGSDLEILQSKAQEIRNTIDNIPGLADLSLEQSYGQPQIQIIADRQKCARYGVNTDQVMQLVETAIGGKVIDQIYINDRRYDIQVRYLPNFRNEINKLEGLLVENSIGTKIPLSEVADIRQHSGPIQINRENNQRRWIIQGNVRNRDLGSVVADIQEVIDKKVKLPDGYYIEYGGQFENQVRAMTRLSIIVPAIIAGIFLMLYLAFGSTASALLIMVNIPLSLIGGIFGLYFLGEYLSVPAAVGFIALFGIAIQDSIVLVTCINQLRQEGDPIPVINGCHQRFRPVMITSITTILGLMPLLLSNGIGAEVQRPLAVVVVFGLASSTILTLFVIPAFYSWFMPTSKKQ